jgi:hypothetical protein
MTNPFFPTLTNADEQLLLHDILTEVIDITGFDCYYVPRTLSATLDRVLTEDTQAQFNSAWPTTMYLQSAEQFEGMGHFLGKTGWTIQDQITLVISRRTFGQEVAVQQTPVMSRPLEGDLVYVPFNQRLFVIRFVEKYSMLYPLGALPTWRLQCEVYEATGVQFNTGIEGIDAFEKTTSLDIFRWAVKNENGLPITVNGNNYWTVDGYGYTKVEPEDHTQIIHTAANTVLDFDETNPFGDAS